MSEYIVSARKYRPDSFGSLIGQDTIAQTLKNSILRNQLAHAYLFCGPRGVGKTSAARIFAKVINCAHPTADMEPCGECESCRSFAEGRSYCIHELDAASNNGVEDIRALVDQVQVPPQIGRYSVYIIDEVHMLSQSAFNAFLKTLEEPPAHAIFILATTEKHKIITTILSRCQTFDFNRIGISDIVFNLSNIARKEGITIDDASLHVIAQKADGAMRDALTIFDQTVAFCGSDVHYEDVIRNLNVLDYEYGFRLVDAFLSKDYASALLIFDEVLRKGFNALYFISALGSHLRDLLVCRSGALDSLLNLPDTLRARYAEQASRCSVSFIFDALGVVSQCESGYRTATNQRLHIEFSLMRLSFLAGVPAEPAARTAPAAGAPALSTSAPASGMAPAAAGAASTVAAAAPAPAPGAASAARAAVTASSSSSTPSTDAAMPKDAEPAAEPNASGASAPATGAASAARAAATASSSSSTPSTDAAMPKDAEPAADDIAERRRRAAARRPKGSLSMMSLLDDIEVEIMPADDGPASGGLPSEESIKEKWSSILEMFKTQPRLQNALGCRDLKFADKDGKRIVTVTVFNEAQKKWIEENSLRKIESELQKLVSSKLVQVLIDTEPQDNTERIIYTAAEKAQDLMSKNEEFRTLVGSLELDV
ncbi:MAG: DNA polymerase III subunit gamma/tau [Bacteroidales bacterium]|nr:DNA polymerase III subunit gamma/tau [Bacteroidales bacterium]